AKAAPPQDGSLLDQVVQPRLANLLRRQIPAVIVVLQRPQKRERPRNVVVGHDEWDAKLFVDVIIDLPESFEDLLIRPSFKGPSQIDPDDLSQHARVNPLFVIVGEHSRRSFAVQVFRGAKLTECKFSWRTVGFCKVARARLPVPRLGARLHHETTFIAGSAEGCARTFLLRSDATSSFASRSVDPFQNSNNLFMLRRRNCLIRQE